MMGTAAILGGPRDYRFRIDPKSLDWSYSLNTATQSTYGGQVVQILSTTPETLNVGVDIGRGGQQERFNTVLFLRDLALWQRDTGRAVDFVYPPRNVHLKVYFTSTSFSDALDDVAKSMSITFKVEEDLDGSIQQASLTNALERIRQNVGFTPAPKEIRRLEGPSGNNTSGNRTVIMPDGGAVSQNGWPALTGSSSSLVNLPYVSGKVHTATLGIFTYICQQFNSRVEPIRKTDSWGFASRNISGGGDLSNHASGTAIDLNASSHPMGKSNTFSAAQQATIRSIIAPFGSAVRWGGDYRGRKDDMHVEINVPPNSAAFNQAVSKVSQLMS